jgi:hypothetical protein
MRMISGLHLEQLRCPLHKPFMSCTNYDMYLSFDTFKDFLTKHINSITLRTFLQMSYKEVKTKIDEVESFLLPVADIFIESQIIFAYGRLTHLLQTIEYSSI